MVNDKFLNLPGISAYASLCSQYFCTDRPSSADLYACILQCKIFVSLNNLFSSFNKKIIDSSKKNRLVLNLFTYYCIIYTCRGFICFVCIQTLSITIKFLVRFND